MSFTGGKLEMLNNLARSSMTDEALVNGEPCLPNPQMSAKTAQLYFDGGTFPLNPGHGGCGAVLEVGGQKYSFWEYLGERETNNRAEYGGLLLGLKKALEMGVTHLNVYGDSQLVINQVKGNYACRNRGLIPLWQEAQKLAKQFQSCDFQWIPREQNQKADLAASQAIKSVMRQAAEIPDDLPVCEPREGLKSRIRSLNEQGEGAKFKEWLLLKSGRDEFSRLRGKILEAQVPDSVREALAAALTEEERPELYERALR
ncbi:MAG: ribonuclease HI family protein [Microcystaceae cyanobacterium]